MAAFGLFPLPAGWHQVADGVICVLGNFLGSTHSDQRVDSATEADCAQPHVPHYAIARKATVGTRDGRASLENQ